MLSMAKTLILALALVSSYALAEEARKINFTETLVDQDNNVIRECADYPPPKTDAECKVRQTVTLGMIVMRALVQPEQGLSPEKSLERGQLALRIYKSEDAVLKAEEVALIKSQIAKIFSPLIVVRTFPMLDPATGK